MKTKLLTPREAIELLLLTGKPLPLTNGIMLHAVNVEALNESNLFFCSKSGFYIGWIETAEIEIPEGRNPDELTIAHLQINEKPYDKGWMPHNFEIYFFRDIDGSVQSSLWLNTLEDRMNWAKCNCFPSEETVK